MALGMCKTYSNYDLETKRSKNIETNQTRKAVPANSTLPVPPPPPHEMLHTMKCYKRTNHLGNLTQLSFLKVKQPDLASSTTEHCVNLDVKIAEYCESCCI